MNQANFDANRDLARAQYKVGWYQIGRSHDFPAGRAVKLWYFSREFVAFRDGDGRVAVVDPYCPHLGAYLGAAKVVDGTIQCPFHGWRFQGDGRCTAIPYGSVPAKARVRSWETAEVNGDVYLYYDPEHKPPAYPVPVVPEFDPAAWTSAYKNEVVGNLQPYDLYENSVDTGHFVFIHGFTELPSIRLEASPWALYTVIEGNVNMHGFIKQAVRFRAWVHGPGISLTWIDTGLRLWTYLNATPIEPGRARVFVTNFIEKASIPWLLRPLVVRLFSWGFMFNLRRDMKIFGQRVNPAHPVLCDGDGPIIHYRRWFTDLPDAVLPATQLFSISQRRDKGTHLPPQAAAATSAG